MTINIDTEQRVGNELFLTDRAIIGYKFIKGCETARGGQRKEYKGFTYTFIGNIEEECPIQKRKELAFITLAKVIGSFFIALIFSSVREDLEAAWTGKERVAVYAIFTNENNNKQNIEEDQKSVHEYGNFCNVSIINKEYSKWVREGDDRSLLALANQHKFYFDNDKQKKHLNIIQQYVENIKQENLNASEKVILAEIEAVGRLSTTKS